MVLIAIIIIVLSFAWFSAAGAQQVGTNPTTVSAATPGVILTLEPADPFLDDNNKYVGQTGLGLTMQSNVNVDEDAIFVYTSAYNLTSAIEKYNNVAFDALFTLQFTGVEITKANGDVVTWSAYDPVGLAHINRSFTWRMHTDEGNNYGPSSDVAGDGSVYGFAVSGNQNHLVDISLIFVGEETYSRYNSFLAALDSGEEPTYYDFGDYTQIFSREDNGQIIYYAYQVDSNGNYVMEPVLDENEDPVPAEDENGSPIYQRDPAGNIRVDENGDPIPEIAMQHVLIEFEPYATTPTTEQKWHSIVLQEGLVGTDLSDYHFIGSTLKIMMDVVYEDALVPWNGDIMLDVSAISWFENDDALAYMYAWYSDGSYNAVWPGVQMTEAEAGVYTGTTDTTKTLAGVKFMRTNPQATYVYNQSSDYTVIPSSHMFVLDDEQSSTDKMFTIVNADAHTPSYAITLDVQNAQSWLALDPTTKIYVWYTEGDNGWPGVAMTKNANNTYSARLSDVMDEGKTLAGFLFTRNVNGTTYNKTHDCYALPQSRTYVINSNDDILGVQ